MKQSRTAEVMPLQKLKLTDEDYEGEEGRGYGTMAYVVERLFSVSALLRGLQLADTSFNHSEPKVTVSKNHRFRL